jgi:hypothetical protein
MTVPSYRRHAAVLLLLFAGLATVLHAAGFDENVKSPQMKSISDLRLRAQSYSTRFEQAFATSSLVSITDHAMAQERFDLAWQMRRAIDARLPLGDLSAIGIVNRGDGTYSVDLTAFPQWNPLDEKMIAILSELDLDQLGVQLVNRGFVESDVVRLKEYVATHDVRSAIDARTRPIALGFSRSVRGYDTSRRAVPASLALSFIYQRESAASLAMREWSENLLATLDPRSARVFVSLLAEGESSSIWSPSDPVEGIRDIMTAVRQPDFEQRVGTHTQEEDK